MILLKICENLSHFSIEFALRQVDPSVAIPYWDSSLDENLPNARDSIMWSSDFMGEEDDVSAFEYGHHRDFFRRAMSYRRAHSAVLTSNESDAAVTVQRYLAIVKFDVICVRIASRSSHFRHRAM